MTQQEPCILIRPGTPAAEGLAGTPAAEDLSGTPAAEDWSEPIE